MMRGSKTSKGFLFLSHQGFSFIDDLASLARILGHEVYILSSHPSDQNQSRIGHIRKLADWSQITSSHALTPKEVLDAISELKTTGRQISGCISVWEGYRALMAQANSALGLQDLTVDQIKLLQDKYLLRKRLHQAGLSSVQVSLIRNAEDLSKCTIRNGFVKPRRGLASFAASRMKPEFGASALLALQNEIKHDPEYRDVIASDGCDFIIEDYIPGIEASFEVIGHNGVTHVIAVHEKVGLEELHSATLETCCVSPPINITDKAIEDGKKYLSKVFALLGLETGCFHVEMRFDQENARWELIEINVRVGGAFINASTKALTGGTCLLELWLKLFALPANCTAQILRDIASMNRETETFFRVYFGHPGRVIQSIGFKKESNPPAQTRTLSLPGDRLPDSSREIFLAQALWTGSSGALTNRLHDLVSESARAFQVEYVQ